MSNLLDALASSSTMRMGGKSEVLLSTRRCHATFNKGLPVRLEFKGQWDLPKQCILFKYLHLSKAVSRFHDHSVHRLFSSGCLRRYPSSLYMGCSMMVVAYSVVLDMKLCTHSSFLNKKLLLQTVYLHFPSEPALPNLRT